MCGVFGFLFERTLSDSDVQKARLGTKALAHRGPDGQGEWFDREAGCFLGHTRLSIVDLSSRSDQPMRIGTHVISYNGEIYNYREVRRELETLGESFETEGDTEVVLRAWRRWGEEALNKFDGMFAFAVWDGSSVCLVTDPFGEKPLYLAEVEGGFAFASEPAVLADQFGYRPALDSADWCEYLALGNLRAPNTVFKRIRRIPAATIQTIARGTETSGRVYWHPPAFERHSGPVQPLTEDDLDQIESVLANSVSLRLTADVPVGLFLSAGVDSALIAALLVHRLGRKDVRGLTVAFPGGDAADESEGAAKIAGHLDLEHEVLQGDAAMAQASPGMQLQIMGQPHDNLSAIAIRALSKSVADRVKVCLTGMGGDEFFLGYGKHTFLYRHRHLYAANAPLSGLLRLASGLVSDQLAAARTLETIMCRRFEIYPALKNMPAIKGLRRVPGFGEWSRETFGKFQDDPFAWVPTYELRAGLSNDQLVAYDHGSMRSSVELRAPFLSRELLELLTSFDLRRFLAFGQKSVLRRILARYVPAEISNREKTGFRLPHDTFLGHAEAPRNLPGLPDAVSRDLWRRRGDAGGWRRLAVRLALADAAFNGT